MSRHESSFLLYSVGSYISKYILKFHTIIVNVIEIFNHTLHYHHPIQRQFGISRYEL